MPIILKHINTSDSDQIKLDNVNYNFDQLVWNGGGPRGPQGSIGQTGPQGTTGWEGVQGVGTKGDQGYQGPAGSTSNSYWKKIGPGYIDADTLVPVHISNNHFAPVINIGYIDTDPEYSSKAVLVGGKTPYQWIIHRKAYLYSNLRFLNSLIPGNAYDFKLEKTIGGSPKDQMSMGFFDLTDSISTYRSVQTSFRDSISSTDSLSIQSSETSFKKPTIFNSPAVIKHVLRIQNADEGTDKVATSSNDTGLVKFKTVQDLKGTVPFGTIVSILPSIFTDDSKFVNFHSANLLDGASPLHIYVGKGVGIYDGWYLCNGKVWTDGDVAHSVPMLGQFNYKIDDNLNSNSPLGQGVVPLTTNNKTHITGGSDIDMVATPISTLVYNITSTVDTSSVTVGAGTGTTFKIKQLPQIIYLGRNDLYWFDAGQNQNPPIPLTFLLDDANTTASKLNPDPYTLSNITDRASGNVYTFTSTITAPSGYYWSTTPSIGAITGLPGYATITDITIGSGAYPNTINVTFSISSHPSAPTLPATGWTVTLGINTTSYISLSSIEITLNRANSANVTCSTPESTSILYNFSTGYTFQLIYQADAGWKFNIPPISTILYDNGPNFSPPVGGGTITILNYVLSNSDKTLTMNVSLTGVPTTGYLTTQAYSIVTNRLATAPIISYSSGGFYPITGGQGSAVVSTNITIENYTGSTIYVYVGITQLVSGTNAGFSAYYVKTTSPTFSLSATAGTAAGNYYSSNSYTLTTGSTITGAFYRASTTDTSHTVNLYYSTSLGGTKIPFTY